MPAFIIEVVILCILFTISCMSLVDRMRDGHDIGMRKRGGARDDCKNIIYYRILPAFLADLLLLYRR